jgi:hypothetical protein
MGATGSLSASAHFDLALHGATTVGCHWHPAPILFRTILVIGLRTPWGVGWGDGKCATGFASAGSRR